MSQPRQRRPSLEELGERLAGFIEDVAREASEARKAIEETMKQLEELQRQAEALRKAVEEAAKRVRSGGGSR